MEAPDIQIVTATLEHASLLAPLMRGADVAEVRASGGYSPLEALRASVNASSVSFTLMIDGTPAAMFGVAPSGSGGDVGIAWLLTGLAVEQHQLAFLRLCKPRIQQLLEIYPILINAIDARYDIALRWARWLGFTVNEPAPFGHEGRPFHLISMRKISHV